MKTLPLALLVALPVVLPAAEVRIGDSLNEVRTVLAEPAGQVRIGDRQLLFYDRGEIELRAGVVARVALIPVEDFARLQARRAEQAVRAREEREIRQARLSAEGTELRGRKLADPYFRAAPAAYQLAFWEDFSRRYPDVACTEQLADARARRGEQLDLIRAKDEADARVAELEARLQEVESKVAQNGTSVVRYRYYSYGRNSPPFTLWPVEYHFANQTPLYPATPFKPAAGSGSHAHDTTRPNQNFHDRNCDDSGKRGDQFDRGSRTPTSQFRL